jgi:hypothetical protein
MRRSKRLALVGSSVLAAAAVAAVPAAGRTSYSTHLTLSQKAPAFHGKIFSPGGALCKNHRTIQMLRVRRGRDKVLGVTTSRRGRWFVSHPNFPSGEYYAKALRGGSAALGITCRPTRSRIVVVD